MKKELLVVKYCEVHKDQLLFPHLESAYCVRCKCWYPLTHDEKLKIYKL